MKPLTTVLVTAYAKAPQGTAMYESYKHIGVVLEIDCKTHQVVQAEVTVLTHLAQRFFNDLLIGIDFTEPLEDVCAVIKKHYLAPSTGSVIVALKNAQKRYVESI